MRVVVKKRRWLRGEGNDASYLFRPKDRKMCCIGFLAKRLGCSTKEIYGKTALDLLSSVPAMTFEAQYSGALHDAYEINDDEDINDQERTQRLREIGKAMGVKFVFSE